MSWFSTSIKCVEKSCTVVHPDWFKSFGFGELPISLEEKADALDCDLQRKLALAERSAAAKRTGADIGMPHPLEHVVFVCHLMYTMSSLGLGSNM